MSAKGLRSNDVTPLAERFTAIPKRGLTEDSIKKYNILVNLDKTKDIAHVYPYFKEGEHVANKVRTREKKSFYWEAEDKSIINSAELFGQHLFPPGCANSITIVEGELDAPSAYQLHGSRYPVVSVQSASSAVRNVKENYEYLNSFDDIVICFDNDEPGQKAAEKVASLFQPGKCRILCLQHGKDPSEYLQNKIPAKTFVNEWWKAAKFSPSGLKAGSSMKEEILTKPEYFTVPYPWEGLNKKTYGIRLSELVLLMADTGVGKTSIFKEIEHHLIMHEGLREAGLGVGILHLEEPNRDTAIGLLSIESNKPYHLPDTEYTDEELVEAFDKVLNNDRVILYDHFGSNNIDEVLSKVRHMAVMGCKYIFIDHLSIIVSDQSGDERKQLDEISTKLKTLTVELNISVFCVIHTNRQGEARGSAGPEKVANIHMSLRRDKKDPDEWRRNVLKIEIEKNRFCGRTGPALWLFYDEGSGRLIELDEDMVIKYEQGGTANDSDTW